MVFSDFNVKALFEQCLAVVPEPKVEFFEDTLHTTWQDDEFIPAGNNELFVDTVGTILYKFRNTNIGIGYHDLEYILNDQRRNIGKWFTNEPTITRVIEELIYALKKRELTIQKRHRYKRLLRPFMSEEFAKERFDRIFHGTLEDDELAPLMIEYLWDKDLIE